MKGDYADGVWCGGVGGLMGANQRTERDSVPRHQIKPILPRFIASVQSRVWNA